jgi:hypothetical protein
MEIRLVLEEVEMPPGPVQGVMDVAFLGLLAGGARELGSFDEVDPKVEPAVLLGKLEIDDLPGLGESEGQSKQTEFVHRGVSFQSEIRLESYHGRRASLNHVNPHKMEENHLL